MRGCIGAQACFVCLPRNRRERQSRGERSRNVNADRSLKCECCARTAFHSLKVSVSTQTLSLLNPCFFSPRITLTKCVLHFRCKCSQNNPPSPLHIPTHPQCLQECVHVLKQQMPANERNLSDGPHGLSLPIKTMDINGTVELGKRRWRRRWEGEGWGVGVEGLTNSNNSTQTVKQ